MKRDAKPELVIPNMAAINDEIEARRAKLHDEAASAFMQQAFAEALPWPAKRKVRPATTADLFESSTQKRLF